MKYTTTSKDSFALQTFRELIQTMESDKFKSQLRDVIKTINIQGFFKIHQDVYSLDMYCDVKEELSKNTGFHWLII